MKRNLKFILLTFLLIMSCVSVVLASDNANTKDDEKHDFTVVPGTQAWNNMSPDERVEVCSVSSEEMENMSTSALISTILEYPYIINIFAYDSPQEGIDSLKDIFSGIEILAERDDALDELNIYLYQLENNESGVDELVLKTIIDYIDYKNGSLRTNAGLTRATKATVYTPNGTAVEAYYDSTWRDAGCSESYAVEISNRYLELYPSAQIVRTPSPKYNCHSYAWHSTSAGNLYWIDDPTAYMSDGSYQASYAKKNNKITYRDNSTYKITHSGIVNSTENGVYVFSKWSNWAVFYHQEDDCPYAANGGITIQYWSRE